MLLEGTIRNGVVVFDPAERPLPDGTRVQIAATTGMEPAIRKTPGVQGGDACIRQTRIPVWLLASYRRSGLTEARILESYPTLTDRDLQAAWAYESTHQMEIDETIREQESA